MPRRSASGPYRVRGGHIPETLQEDLSRQPGWGSPGSDPGGSTLGPAGPFFGLVLKLLGGLPRPRTSSSSPLAARLGLGLHPRPRRGDAYSRRPSAGCRFLPPPESNAGNLCLRLRANFRSPNGAATPRWRLVPTRREQAKWDRASKAATGGSDVMLRESNRVQGDPKVLAAQARKEYFKLKQDLQILTLGIGGVGVVSAYVSYSPEIAASFGAGFLGSLVYIRMLGNSVDSMADGAKGLVKGAIGQPRLLVPVALVMIYNRWNGILVPDYGFIHLQLIPMLVGFFTYKIATFVQAIQEASAIFEKRNQV